MQDRKVLPAQPVLRGLPDLLGRKGSQVRPDHKALSVPPGRKESPDYPDTSVTPPIQEQKLKYAIRSLPVRATSMDGGNQLRVIAGSAGLRAQTQAASKPAAKKKKAA